MFLSLQLLGAHLSILQEALTHRKIEARSEEVPGGFCVVPDYSSWRVDEEPVLSVNQIPLAVPLLLHIPFFQPETSN